ncbi:hypothetical protein ROR02_26860 [Pararhodospirillum oryzae]|uniref:N-acetyltransferase domain-containing protein n=2 Tax=Pararhodospirillum oryzae TaxID=478448 RepID=A0A512HAU1_9PROT|nr:hypothetical protein ROR02_26860 [Pararhodospirillum oryzae]
MTPFLPRMTPLSGADPALRAALESESLPVDDLGDEGRVFFVFHDDQGALMGFGGLEQHGALALMRSVVVVPERRGQGLGTALLSALLDHARALGCRDAYLLTTTAVALGRRCGFRFLPRDEAPGVIRASRQMASLCPASAVLMTRSL